MAVEYRSIYTCDECGKVIEIVDGKELENWFIIRTDDYFFNACPDHLPNVLKKKG